MATLPTDFDELLFASCGGVSLTVKGERRISGGSSAVEISCTGDYILRCLSETAVCPQRTVTTAPVFFTDGQYELVAEGADNLRLSLNGGSENILRPTGSGNGVSSGVITLNVGAGYSRLELFRGNQPVFRLFFEMFPCRTEYLSDRAAMLSELGTEVYTIFAEAVGAKLRGERQSAGDYFDRIEELFTELFRAADRIISRTRTERPRKNTGCDTPENRRAAYVLRSMLAGAAELRRGAELLLSENCTELLPRLDRISDELLRRLNTPPFSSNAGRGYERATRTFCTAEGYRDLHRVYEKLRSILAVGVGVFRAPVWEQENLYRRWCFMRINAELRRRYALTAQDMVRFAPDGLRMELRSCTLEYRDPSDGRKLILKHSSTGNFMLIRENGKSWTGQLFMPVYSADAKGEPERGDLEKLVVRRDAESKRNKKLALSAALLLFPAERTDWERHRFYESLDKSGLGAIPMLPQSVGVMDEYIDRLLPVSTVRASGMARLDEELEGEIDGQGWDVRDVLVGSLRDRGQLGVCLEYKFYHIPLARLDLRRQTVRYVAIYQSRNLYGADAGIRWYGEVAHIEIVRRYEIEERPSSSKELYCRMDIREWKELPEKIKPTENGSIQFMTTYFLLTHAAVLSELRLRNEEEFRLYRELMRTLTPGTEARFANHGGLVTTEDDRIFVYRGKLLVAEFFKKEFSRSPVAVMGRIMRAINRR